MEALRILNLEDDPLDTELIQADLAAGGIPSEITRVYRRDDFLAALEKGDFDLVLSDYSLPGFDGLTALEITREIRPEVPFIFVSGAIGEERAIESLKNGATDYVLKYRLERLVPAVRRAVREVEERTERRRAEEALKEVREAERTRIARDLHDVVLQDLSTILQTLQAKQVQADELGMEVGLQQEIDTLRRAVMGLRDAIYDLRPESGQEFLEAVGALVEYNRRLAPDREISLTVQGEFPKELPDAVKVELVRIIREALTNAHRHSSARRVSVVLRMAEGEMRALISDNGKGFEPQTARRGVGISAMQERAAAIGGDLEVQSQSGGGTRVVIQVPLFS